MPELPIIELRRIEANIIKPLCEEMDAPRPPRADIDRPGCYLRDQERTRSDLQ